MNGVSALVRATSRSLGRSKSHPKSKSSYKASSRQRTLASRYGSRPYTTSIAEESSMVWLGVAGASLAAGSFFLLWNNEKASAGATAAPGGPFSKAGEEKNGLPTYSKEDVASHKTPETGIWVSYKAGVYDITQFVEEHPGGKTRIMLAAGGSIEAFWALYQQHVSDEVAEILERHRIGNLRLEDRSSSHSKDGKKSNTNDPYGNDPERHPALLARMQKPFNAETPPILLTESLLTPNEIHYIRNHLPVPEIDPQTYVLEISIEGRDQPFKLTLEDLKRKFPKHEVDVTIQCAGNRRTALNQVKEVRGLAWDIGAIGTAKWGGARLRDVLMAAGLDINDEALMDKLQHIHFEGLDTDFEKSYTASIPSEKAIALKGDCVIAYEMNGTDIPRDHGFPVRAVVPGTVGARNVKWLHKIRASSSENEGHWQQNDYKGFSPNIDWGNVDYKTAPAIQDLPIQSAITIPAPNTVLEHGTDEVPVKGYAWAGGGRGIVRVDVSGDGGKTWHTAKLERPNQSLTHSWAWTLFSTTVPITPGDSGQVELVCKAVDSSYNSQPDTTAPIWNLRGVLSTSWHKVPIMVAKSEESL